MNKLWEAFKRFAAPPSWDASFTPMILGFTCAFTIGGAKLSYGAVGWMLLAFFAIALIETGKHALNEIMDFRSGDDVVLEEDHLTPFSGGKKVLRYGLVSEKQVWGIAAVTLGIACLCGLVIAFTLNIRILIIGIVGMAMAILYNHPWTRAIYHGLGEPCIFIAYGPTCAMGAYHMFVREFSWIPFLASLTLGFLIVNVLIMNEFPDYEADLRTGKRNWVVRLGKEKGIDLYQGLYYASYLPLLILMLVTRSPLWLLACLNQVAFSGVVKNLTANVNIIPQLVPSCADTITIHARSGMFMDTVIVMLFLMAG